MGDFLAGCNEQGLSTQEFERTFCNYCRNPDCTRAGWADSLFTRRIATQEQRLLQPLQADPALSKYAPLVQMDFKDMLEQAIRLEIADRRGDWVVPEEGATLEDPTNLVDEAVRKALFFQGPDDESEVDDAVEDPQTGVSEAESSTAGATTAVGTPVGTPVASGVPPATLVVPRAHNTSVPVGGIMLGGAKPPAPEPEIDPWAPPPEPAAVKVPVGGTVRMGGGTPQGNK